MSAEVIPLRAPIRYHETDVGNAERLVARHGDNLRYVPAWNTWLVWDGGRWAKDETGTVEQFAKETVRNILAEAQMATDNDTRRALASHALRSESNGRIKAMIERARVEAPVVVRHSELDADPYRLTVENGTLDLHTGTLAPSKREHLVTKRVLIRYDERASCPGWLGFLDRVLGGSAELIAFVKQAVGYSLTGDTTEQCLFLLHGQGANGKSTFLDILRALAGEYSYQADIATFLERKSDGGPRNDVAGLVGARVVTSSEVGEGKRLNESLVKSLTGGDTISARFLYQEAFEFQPCFKLWIAANHRPVIRGADDGIWRRMRLIPFTVQIPAHEQDPMLSAALRAELPGILAWAVEGCLDWIEHRLRVPDVVRAATDTYRSESDTIGTFLEDACSLDPNYRVQSGELYRSYCTWAETNGHEKMSAQGFGRRLTDRGFVGEKVGSGVTRTVYRIGLRLVGGSVQQPTQFPTGLFRGTSGTNGTAFQ